jgi:hypothetical protein
MNRDTLKTAIGVYLILAHFGAICLVLSFSGRYLEFADAVEMALIMTPVFSLYSVAIIKDFIANQSHHQAIARVNFNFVFISFFLPVIFTSAIYAVLFCWRAGVIASLADFRKAISACEVLFGVYMGFVIDNLFHLPNQLHHSRN